MKLLGGYFGLGWFRDLWRIPSYVREANDDPEYIKNLTEQMRSKKKPPFSFMRFFGQLIVGNVFGQLAMMSIPGPEDLNGLDLLLVADLLAPAATAIGMYFHVYRHLWIRCKQTKESRHLAAGK